MHHVLLTVCKDIVLLASIGGWVGLLTFGCCKAAKVCRPAQDESAPVVDELL